MIELKSGARLQRTESGEIVDVSDRAVEFVFERVILAADVRLRDIFVLIQQNPELFPLFRRYSLKELLAEAFSGEAEPYLGKYGPENVEFLELSRDCDFDPTTNTYWEMDRLTLAGVGFALKRAWVTDSENVAAGRRRRWDMAFVSSRKLLDYPLRFNDQTEIWGRGGQTGIIGTASYGLPTLGQVIFGVVWALTFFGVGDHREDWEAELTNESDAN